MRLSDVFWENHCQDEPLGAIERMLAKDPMLLNSPDYMPGALVMTRTCKHINEKFRWLLCEVVRYHAASGVYTVRVCRSGQDIVMSKYELLPALQN